MSGPRRAVLPVPRLLPIALLCAASFALGLALFTRHNEIPYYYHSDEPSKVAQVVGERRLNFKHPLLLMNATRATASLTGVGDDKQRAAMAGRRVSATFAALSVAMLVALAGLLGGPWAAACAAPVLLLSHGLFTFAHFMKEDTALLVGVAATLLAGSLWVRRPSGGSAALLGVATGLAISGKYIGVAMLAASLPLLALELRRGAAPGARRALALFALGLVATLVLVNVTILFEWQRFRAGLAYETDHATTGGGKPFTTLLSPTYVYGLLGQTTWPVRILSAGWIGFVAATWSRRTPDEKLVALFPVAYLALLWISPIKAIRYLLPVVVGLHLLTGLALAGLLRRFAPRGPARAVGFAAALALVLWPQVRALRVTADAFAHDSRLELYAFVRDRLPPEARILQDRYAGLPDPAWGSFTRDNAVLPHALTTRSFVAELPDVATMRQAGYEYVAVCSRAYERFFGADKAFGSEEARRRFEARRAAYQDLFERGELIFEAGDARVAGAPVDPVVRLYRIAPASGTTPRSPSAPQTGSM